MLDKTGIRLKEDFEKNETVCAQIIDLFQLIGNSYRFKIICILTQGEYNVGEIAEILGTDKRSNLSQQLKVLRLAGIISSRREEKNVIYKLADLRLKRMLDFFKAEYVEKPTPPAG